MICDLNLKTCTKEDLKKKIEYIIDNCCDLTLIALESCYEKNPVMYFSDEPNGEVVGRIDSDCLGGYRIINEIYSDEHYYDDLENFVDELYDYIEENYQKYIYNFTNRSE